MNRAYMCLLAVSFLAATHTAASGEPGRFEGDHATSTVFTGGAMRIGDVGGGGMGARIEYGRRVAPIHLVGEYSLMYFIPGGTDAEPSVGGAFQRAGLTARWPAAAWLVDDESAEIALWLEGGVGVQSMPDIEGSVLRPDLLTGFILEVRGRETLGKDFGIIFGGRLVAAREPDRPQALAIGAGGGGAASRSNGLDTGILITLGVRWRQ